MFQLTVLYHHPEDPTAFDKHYDSVHAPLALKLPHLRRYTVSRPGPDAEGNRPAYHLVAVLEFDSQADFAAGMGSPEGQAAVADLGNFAGAGLTMLTGEAASLT